MKLNPEQKMAVDHLDGPCIVTAVPGSGKTRALTSRVINLIKNKNISPNNILCLTFTNKAAKEMRGRIFDQIGDVSKGVWVGTFHSLCLAILRKFPDQFGMSSDFSVYDELNQIELFKKIARMQEYECKDYVIKFIAKASNDFRENLDNFEDHVSHLKPIERDIIREYLSTLKEFNAVDFSGILYEAWNLLSKHSKIRKVLNNKFKYILIDEGQDTNNVQMEIAKMLAEHTNIFIVSDHNQSVYAWRGSKPENLIKLKKYYKNCKEITFPRNYRSTKQILKAAESLINNNSDSGNVELISEIGSGNNINIVDHASPEDESEWVIDEINKIKSSYGYQYKDIVILYRTNNLSKIPETKLRQANIPYKIIGGFSFFNRKEIKTALSYLSFMINPKDTISFSRAISYPPRSVGPTTIGKIERMCKEKGIDVIQACKNIDSIKKISLVAKKNIKKFIYDFEQNRKNPDLLEKSKGILHDSGFYKYLQDEAKKDNNEKNRIANINELILGISDYCLKHQSPTLSQYLQSIQILTSQDEESLTDAVSLMTCHSSKGLEFNVVFIIGSEEGLFPHVRSIKENRIEEERRLFYVAMTRCKSILYLSHCFYRKEYNFYKKQSQLISKQPSRFISEIRY